MNVPGVKTTRELPRDARPAWWRANPTKRDRIGEGALTAGDVLVETGGERTYIGDTAEDENERRRRAEAADRCLPRDRRRTWHSARRSGAWRVPAAGANPTAQRRSRSKPRWPHTR